MLLRRFWQKCLMWNQRNAIACNVATQLQMDKRVKRLRSYISVMSLGMVAQMFNPYDDYL